MSRGRSVFHVAGLLLLGLLLACGAKRLPVPDAPADFEVWPSDIEGTDTDVHGLDIEDWPRVQRVLLAGGSDGTGSFSVGSARPLTMARLVALARMKGIGTVGAWVTRNHQVGIAFQNAVLKALGLFPANTRVFPTPVRGGRHAGVIPDALVVANRVYTKGGASVRPEGAFLEVVSSEFIDFLEVKGRAGSIVPSSAQGQIRGFIDVLARMRPRAFLMVAGEPPRPALLLVTTADTKVSEAVALEASRRGVAVFRAVALEAEGWISVGPFVQLTSFADVLPRFQFSSTPSELE
jgi:hypothetical protein